MSGLSLHFYKMVYFYNDLCNKNKFITVALLFKLELKCHKHLLSSYLLPHLIYVPKYTHLIKYVRLKTRVMRCITIFY